jgi:hypothetical protein
VNSILQFCRPESQASLDLCRDLSSTNYFMRNLYLSCFALLCFVLNTHAQFSGNYSPSKFTTTLTPGANGSVNASGAPASITITGSNDALDNPSTTPMNVDYTARAASSGILKFDWTYRTNDSDSDPQYDPAGVLINGVFTQLTNSTPNLINQSGSYSVAVTTGAIIGFRISAIDNIFGNATFTISNFSAPASVLPVKLSLFTGKPQGNAILLQWTAATEINAAYYEVQRSANGTSYTNIGKVEAGAITGNYQFLDATPLYGKNHYRLRMVDNDGSFEYSGIVVLTTGITSDTKASLSVFPNPATTAITIVIQSPVTTTDILQLYNAVGARLLSEKLVLPTGRLNKQLNIASLSPGTYFIQLAGSGLALPFVKK